MIRACEVKTALDTKCKSCEKGLRKGTLSYGIFDSKEDGHVCHSWILCPECYAKYEAGVLDMSALLTPPVPEPKKYMLITSEGDDDNYVTNVGTHLGLTEAEAYKIVLDKEAALNHWEHFSYDVYEDSPELTAKLGWVDRLAEDIPKRKAEMLAEKGRRILQKLEEDEERAKRDQERRDKAEYERLRAKFEGEQA